MQAHSFASVGGTGMKTKICWAQILDFSISFLEEWLVFSFAVITPSTLRTSRKHGLTEGRVCSCYAIQEQVCYVPEVWGMGGGSLDDAADARTCRMACDQRPDCRRIAYVDTRKLGLLQ